MAKNAGSKKGNSKNNTERNSQIITTIRQFSQDIYREHKAGKSSDDIQKQIDNQLKSLKGKIWTIMSFFLKEKKNAISPPKLSKCHHQSGKGD